jgi:hypothetical protein
VPLHAVEEPVDGEAGERIVDRLTSIRLGLYSYASQGEKNRLTNILTNIEICRLTG